jgi:addiction module HigA family antidote
VILEEEFLEPLGLSAYALAKAIGVPRNRITGILRGERAITADNGVAACALLRHVAGILARAADGLRP